MRIVIRADASPNIGAGHIMRCLALASALKANGAEVAFICSAASGDYGGLLQRLAYQVYLLPGGDEEAYVNAKQDATDTVKVLKQLPQTDWVIVDHYGLDSAWHRTVAAAVSKIAVIDDLADRYFYCDLLLNQNVMSHHQCHLYDSIVPAACEILLGPQYALLRPEFAQCREQSLQRQKGFSQLNRILVNFGGVDPHHLSEWSLRLIAEVFKPDAVTVDIVLGGQSDLAQQLQRLAAQFSVKTNVHHYVNNMAELMVQSDLAIGAAGSSSWERCCLGLGSLLIITAENQQEVANSISNHNAGIVLGTVQDVTLDTARLTLETLKNNPTTLMALSSNASQLCDGTGAKKVADIIYNFT